METRRSFMGKAALAGIAGIVASKTAPAFAQNMGKIKIGQLGIGSHNYVGRFTNPPADMKDKVRCYPYAIWDDAPGVAEKMKGLQKFEKVMNDPVQLAKESDVIHIEHADYRKSLELARPALEMGKPVFINRPFAGTIADAEELVRLAKAYNAPLMSASTLEFNPVVVEMQKFAKENGSIRTYEAYCGEQHFTWMFPHVFNFAHAAFGGGIESAYFTGTYNLDLGKWIDENKPFGASLAILTWKSRDGQPGMIGMNHIGNYPGDFHINAFGVKQNKMFVAQDVMKYIFPALNAFYTDRIIPRPYEAILEEHRALAATNVSRLSGKTVKLESLGGDDAVPYSDDIRWWVVRNFLKARN
ncbi:MAG: Gfo/Idh/MocA family oxidoreductase [Candidatus Latescibacterota bacterium]